MRFGIIGSGSIGATLTRQLRVLGHDVAVANSRGPQSLTGLAGETGATAATVVDAARDADVVIIAIPVFAVPRLPAEAFREKIVVDANNYYPQRDGDIPELQDRSVTSSRWLAQRLPGARVVKAFNNIHARHLADLGRQPGDGRRIALPVAADDAEAKQIVMRIVDELGFDPIDAGTLDQSWRQQPGTPVYGTDRDADSLRGGLASARP